MSAKHMIFLCDVYLVCETDILFVDVTADLFHPDAAVLSDPYTADMFDPYTAHLFDLYAGKYLLELLPRYKESFARGCCGMLRMSLEGIVQRVFVVLVEVSQV